MSPYDLLPVIIEGIEMNSRPIEFELLDGVPVRAIRWESVNPRTSQLIQFCETQLTMIEDKRYLGKDIAPTYVAPKIENNQPFNDPIEMGLMTI